MMLFLWDPVQKLTVEQKECDAPLNPAAGGKPTHAVWTLSYTFPMQKQEWECIEFMSQRAHGNSQAVEGE